MSRFGGEDPPQRRYESFDLWIDRGRRGYRVRACSREGEERGRFRIPGELEKRWRGPSERKRGSRHLDIVEEGPESPADVAERLGHALFQAVFSVEIRALFRVSLARARDRGSGLRLRLRLSDPKLAALPWEYLYDETTGQHLALSPDTPVVRYLEVHRPAEPLPVELPLRLLVLSANPSDICKLDLDREVELLGQSLADLSGQGSLVLERLEPATPEALADRLARGTFHVLHFMGHGSFERPWGGVLWFENERGTSKRVSARQLATLLQPKSLRLVVLNACEGACVSGDVFAGLAQALVRKGVSAVLAMQDVVPDEVSILFAHHFYQFLAERLPLEEALARTRLAIFAAGHPLEWGTPVLYMRASDGRIVDRPKPVDPKTEGEHSTWFRRVAAAILALVIVAGSWILWQRPFSADNPPECPSPSGLDMAFVLIRPGAFLMEREGEGAPARRVEIRKPFCLGAYEITREQLARGLGEGTEHVTDARLPAGGVTWQEAHVFLSRLNQKESTRVYRLPTDEEWEYAVRAGTPTTYFFGDDSELLHKYGNCSRGDGFDDPAPVGAFQKNPWGLYDVYGNVWEWVDGGAGLRSGKMRVRRGGSWSSGPQTCRSGHRSLVQADWQRQENGFRIVRELP